jgi:hypothetical protein
MVRAPNGSMAPSLLYGQQTVRMQTSTGNMQGERVRNAVTDRPMPLERGAVGVGYRLRLFADGVVAVCFLALVSVAVLGGLLALLSWVAATLPTNRLLPCPELDGCVAPAPDAAQDLWTDEPAIDVPKMTP